MTTDNPKLVLISGASRMGKSTFADAMLERYPQARFRYLSYDALKDMVLRNDIFSDYEIKISSHIEYGQHVAPTPDMLIEKSMRRDQLVWPFLESWALSEMERGHNVIVNYSLHPDMDNAYTRDYVIPIVFLDTRPVEKQFERLRTIRDAGSADNKFNWMTIFDDTQLMRYAKASRARDLSCRQSLERDNVKFYDLHEYKTLNAIHTAAYEKLDSIFR